MTDHHGLTVPQADALWDAIAIPGPTEPTFVEQHNRACRTVAQLLAERPYQEVRGRCPACGWTSLFLGDGGHVTCSRLECPDPSAADELLHAEQPARTTSNNPATSGNGPSVREAAADDRAYWDGGKAGEQ
ncbi:DUF6085 family protein [Streptomyces sp. NPDC005303]|uniref:DUF6085 family protein n=1 Tax=Streptomyces sp. NPDC005303 TaxID=3155713 RepID=UPI0033BCD695